MSSCALGLCGLDTCARCGAGGEETYVPQALPRGPRPEPSRTPERLGELRRKADAVGLTDDEARELEGLADEAAFVAVEDERSRALALPARRASERPASAPPVQRPRATEPLPRGARVRLVVPRHGLRAGTLGTVVHSSGPPSPGVTVRWDGDRITAARVGTFDGLELVTEAEAAPVEEPPKAWEWVKAGTRVRVHRFGIAWTGVVGERLGSGAFVMPDRPEEWRRPEPAVFVPRADIEVLP